jgi:hypothetical protein
MAMKEDREAMLSLWQSYKSALGRELEAKGQVAELAHQAVMQIRGVIRDTPTKSRTGLAIKLGLACWRADHNDLTLAALDDLVRLTGLDVRTELDAIAEGKGRSNSRGGGNGYQPAYIGDQHSPAKPGLSPRGWVSLLRT